MTSRKKKPSEEKPVQPLLGDSRRQALKKMAAGAGIAASAASLPVKWVKPVVNEVFVPVHAQTSPMTYEYFDPSPSPKITFKRDSKNEWLASAWDWVIPEANAQRNGPAPSAICVKVNGPNAKVTWRNQDNDLELSVTVPTDGTIVPFDSARTIDNCEGMPPGPPTVQIINYKLGDPQIVVKVTSGANTENTITLTVPEGKCNLPPFDTCLTTTPQP